MKKNGIITTNSVDHYFNITWKNGEVHGFYKFHHKDGRIVFETHVHQEHWHGARVEFDY